MADEPDDVGPAMRGGTRQGRAELRTAFAVRGKGLGRVARRTGERHETMVTVAGFAMHADVRRDRVTGRLTPLTQRIGRLEERA